MITRMALSSTKYQRTAALALWLLAMIPVSAGAQDDRTLLIRTLNEYLAAWGSMDPQRVAPYYHEPLTVVSLSRVLSLANRADIEAWVKSIYQREK